MRTLEQVNALREQLAAEGSPKPDIIRQLAEACLGWPYVFGAWGEACTPANRRRRVRSDHPTIQSKCQVLNGSAKSCEGCRWDGTRQFDCRGFVFWAFDQAAGIRLSGGGATSQYNHTPNWAARGEKANMPDCVCAVYQKSGSKMQHTGIHIGGGRVIHCSNGVQTGSVADRAWTHWAIPAGLYTPEEMSEMNLLEIVTALKRGSRGEEVQSMQEALNQLGYDCGTADGIFGTKTEEAVRAFQADNGLVVDGVAGKNTLAALHNLTVKPSVGAPAAAPADSPSGGTLSAVTIRLDWETAQQLLYALHAALEEAGA